MSKNTVSNDARMSANAKQASQSVKTIQVAKNAQDFEKSCTNAQIHWKFTSSSSIWAEVVSKNTTKITSQRNKAQTAKLNEIIQWKSRRMIMLSKNFVNDINSTEGRNRINKRLKDEKIDVLITMIYLSRTENSIVFTMSEKNTANQLIQCRLDWPYDRIG